jgi:hypothetical protein
VKGLVDGKIRTENAAMPGVSSLRKVGEGAQGQDHNEAVTLLQSVDKSAAKYLAALLDMKTRSGYSAVKSSTADRRRAKRSADALIQAAKQAI